MHLLKTLIILSALALPVCMARASSPRKLVTISNTAPRRDILSGQIVDVHDGCLERFGDRYYLYGTAYGDTDGFGTTNRYVCYSSADLVHWSFEGELFRKAPVGVYYRPYVKYSKKIKKYVLWYNWYPKLWEGQYGVAVSDKPTGPFQIRNRKVAVKNPSPGDASLFVDDDGSAYLIYTSITMDHGISVERLTDSYLGSTLQSSNIISGGCEAPAMFKRNGTYYVLFDTCCCFGPAGSGARVYTAKSPLGPFTLTGNINRKEDGSPIIPAQQTHVARIETKNGTQYFWMGDRWGSRPDKIKGHDFQYWSSPLEFREDGSIEPLKWEDEWSVELTPPVARASARNPKPIDISTDSPGALRFWGSPDAELYTREIEESFKGVLRKNYISEPDGAFPPGFVHASPVPQGWSGTFWTRDGGTFTRELAHWGYFGRASLTAYYLMNTIRRNPDGFQTYPEYFSGWNGSSGTEVDGTTSIVIAMVLLWQRLPKDDPFRDRIYRFLHDPFSPAQYLMRQLEKTPLVPGSGEFGGGCTIGGLFYNVVQNALSMYALEAMAQMESEAGDAETARLYKQHAAGLRYWMDQYLVDKDGSWIWCVKTDTLKPDPAIINFEINKGFGGLNGPACMYSDALGIEPLKSTWKGIRHSEKTFEKLYAVPSRREQFDKYGIWTQFDEFRGGMSSGPAYGDGYAVQTMLLFDKLDMADKSLSWIANSTFNPVYGVTRESPYYFYEQTYTPDAVGKIGMGEGCGALNLVSVTEQLKAARLILGVDDSSLDQVKIIPRLPASWKGVGAVNWPIRTQKGMVRAHIRFEKTGDNCAFSIKLDPGQKIPKLAVRLPGKNGYTWKTLRDVTEKIVSF